MQKFIFTLNLISKYIFLLSILILPIVMDFDTYIFPNFEIPSILYLMNYSNFKIVTMNTLVFTMYSGFFIWILTTPYLILNTINIFLGKINKYPNIQKLYDNFNNCSTFFLVLSEISIFYFVLFYLNYVDLFQIDIPFIPKNMILGISESKFFLFLFSVLFNMIGIGYCINISMFMLFFLLFRMLNPPSSA